MSSEFAICTEQLSKCYTLNAQPSDRLKQLLRLNKVAQARQFWALQDINLKVGHGEVLGIIGRNGAGKSTLLQLLCGILDPSGGRVEVNGRVAALLELGAGFNAEFTGRENIYFNAAILGLSKAEIAAKLDDIIAFADIGPFVDQPVKTYSSGMFLRLAFSVAVGVDPEILIIDEALSVGDGAFARKSFDRIMTLKDAGKTILFCSHAMFQVDAFCNRALWLNEGRVAMLGKPTAVIAAYEVHLAQTQGISTAGVANAGTPQPPTGTGQILNVELECDGVRGREVSARTCESTLLVLVDFLSDSSLPTPSLAVTVATPNGTLVASVGSHNDGVVLTRNLDGRGSARLVFPELQLLQGDYVVSVLLLCERGIHLYNYAHSAAELHVSQRGLEQGIVTLPHRWQTPAP